MKRPIGVTIIAVLSIIAAVVGLLAVLPFFGISLGAFGATLSQVTGLSGNLLLGLGIVGLVLAIAELVFGIGALQMKSWAWTLGIVLFGLSLVMTIVSMFTVGFAWSGVLSGVIALAVLVYLFTGEVREAFGHGSSHVSSGSTPTMSH